jgi:imidazolonepropionase-like amidohydrolase
MQNRCLCRLLGVAFSLAMCARAQNTPITIRASTVLDGKGATLRNVRIVIEGARIVRVEPAGTGPASYDLSGLTVMPGWIDTHVHINGHFNKQGRADNRQESPAEFNLRTAGTAWATLQNGFTTVQSIGADTDKPLRDLINEDVIPGPAILTSLTPLTERSGSPEEIRAKVRKLVADGADVIKLFATASSRDGGKQTMTDQQIQAACGEATAQGRRSAVHAHASSGAKAAVLAGCTSIEHGTFLDDEVLELMAQHGTYLDPNLSNVHNYLDHKQAFLGLGNFTEKGFALMAEDLPIRIATIHRARAKKVKIVFGTDAVAGGNGFNREEFINRVRDAGQPATECIVSATSRAAEALGLGKQIGSIAAGMQADLVATDGNPLDDITSVRKVAFVMRKGKVYKNLRIRAKQVGQPRFRA